jgi:transcriptional regulator with XRE-family HTH domain
MYNAQLTSNRIKELAKRKKIQLDILQRTVGLSKNAIQASSKSKNGLGALFLYNLSKELDCSVDYLLGRTDVIELNQNTPGQKNESDAVETLNAHDNISVSDDITEMTEMIKKLPLVKRAEVILMIHKMLEEQ